MSNPFDSPSAAAAYARYRPRFHRLVMECVRAVLAPLEPLPWALDVGCGTGQSSEALRALAAGVVACDPSAGMLGLALPTPGVHYVRAAAEYLPVASGQFGLITASAAFHWFDRARFTAEARRVLVPGGWLVIYNGGFAGAMPGNRPYTHWVRKTYRKRFPVLRRNADPITSESMAPFGFCVEREESLEYELRFTVDELAGYLTTHSNAIARIESGQESLEGAVAWLREQVRPFFVGDSEAFRFTGSIFYLRRTV